MGVLKRELVLKELRVFFRDTTQWSQLILLAVLVIVYVFNIKYLRSAAMGLDLSAREPCPLSQLGAGGVCARVDRGAFHLSRRQPRRAHAVAPALQSDVDPRSAVGQVLGGCTLPLLILALAIVFVTDYMLEVSEFMFTVSVFTIAMMTFAVSGLALGFGTLFPQFDTENAAQIPTSFGGLLVFMMASVAMIGGWSFLRHDRCTPTWQRG